MKKILYLPILLLLAANVQAQNEDPTCPNPDDCILFVRTEWKDMNDPETPDPTKDLRRLTIGILPELDSIFVRIGTERDKGEALDIRGKRVKVDAENRYIDFGVYGKIFINSSTNYLAYIDFDLTKRKDRDKFIFLTIRAKDATGTRRDMRVRQIGQTAATYSNIKSQLQFSYTLEPKTKLLSLQYFLSSPTTANFGLHSSNGTVVKKLETNSPQAGHIQKVYDLNGLATGMYLLQLQLGQTTLTEKINIQ